MNKGFQSKDTIEQCKKLETANISYNFFYLTGISGAGRGEIGAKASAELFNQLHPQIIESSMLTIYKEFHHIGASAARDGHSCFLRMCMIHKVMY